MMFHDHIIIESPGMLTTVQDAGRYGFQRFGMPVSGAADVYSLQLANLLVGNAPGMAGLEVTLTGPEIRFMATGWVAVCGGGMQPLVNGEGAPGYQTIAVRAGDLLGFQPVDRGCRTYIAFAGGLDVKEYMGSRSTCLRSGLGGLEGRALKKDDTIPVGMVSGRRRIRQVPEAMIPDYSTDSTLRIMPGPETGRLTFEGLKRLMNNTYEISNHSDRMGYRLEGEPVILKAGGYDILSAGIAFGTVQVAGNGHPIIMLADRQTTGGYARVAIVASIDHSRLAQLRPGDRVRFEEIRMDQAQALFRARHMEMYNRIN